MRKKKSFPKAPKTRSVEVLKRYHDRCLEIAAYNNSIDRERETMEALNRKISEKVSQYSGISTAPYKKPKLAKRPKSTAGAGALNKYLDTVEQSIKKLKEIETEAKKLSEMKQKINAVKSGKVKLAGGKTAGKRLALR